MTKLIFERVVSFHLHVPLSSQPKL